MRLRDLYENENKREKTWNAIGTRLLIRGAFDRTCVFGNRTDYVAQRINQNKADQEEIEYAKRMFDALFEEAMEADPTPERQSSYVPWILRTYLNGGIRFWEDITRVGIALSAFHEMKVKRVFQNSEQDTLDVPDIGTFAMNGDINQFKQLPHLEAFIRALVESGGGDPVRDKNFVEQVKKYNASGEITVIKHSDDYRECVILLKSYEASEALFKQRTSWCTTSSEELFDEYTMSDDFLYGKDMYGNLLIPDEYQDEYENDPDFHTVAQDYEFFPLIVHFDLAKNSFLQYSMVSGDLMDKDDEYVRKSSSLPIFSADHGFSQEYMENLLRLNRLNGYLIKDYHEGLRHKRM